MSESVGEDADEPANGEFAPEASVSLSGDEALVRMRRAFRDAGGQASVARRAGVSDRTLSRLMSGQSVRRSTFLTIADAAQVSPEWLLSGDGPIRRGLAEAPLAPIPPARSGGNLVSAADFGMQDWLKSAVAALGGAEQAAVRAMLPLESVRAALSGRRVPAAELQALIAAATHPAPTTPAVTASGSIWDHVDLDVLVACFELQEELDLAGGGQLRSARSRLRRALNAYDLYKNDRE